MFKILPKLKTLKFKEFFEIISPTYSILKITPDTSIRNYESSNIAKAITFMRKRLAYRIKKDKFKIYYEKPTKVSFIIDITSKDIKFYFICPQLYKNVVIEQCTSTWPKSSIEEVDSIKEFSEKAIKYQVYTQKEDALSIKIDKKLNEPLNHLLNVVDIMEEEDRITLAYNFIPCPQKPWQETYNKTMEKLKNNIPIDKNKNDKLYYSKIIFIGITKLMDLVLYALDHAMLSSGKKAEKPTFDEVAISSLQKALTGEQKKFKPSTSAKKDATVIKNQIVVISDSGDKARKENNAKAACEAYKILDEDNKFTYERFHKKRNFSLLDYDYKTIENTLSTDECKMFLELPGRNLLSQFKNIEQIEVQQCDIPEELRIGDISLGVSEFKNNKTEGYFTNDKELSNLTTVIIGPTRAGKSVYIGNYSRDCLKSNQCVVIVDFCENCELSDTVKNAVGSDKCLIIDCSNENELQGLGYNELKSSLMSNGHISKYMCTKMMTKQLQTLINSINDKDKDFSAKMGRFIKSAAMTVFITGDSSVKSVIDCLQDYKVRTKYISMIPEEERDNMLEYISAMEELNEYDKKTGEVVGTKISYLTGILDRIDKLTDNGFLELMYRKGNENNINFVDQIQKYNAILIKMPEYLFQTQQEKDIAVTYWISKIWLAAQLRSFLIPNKDERTKVAVIVDEIYQTPFAQALITDKLSQCAKFRLRFVISCHYLNQIRIIRDELKAANSSYMLIAGCDKDNFSELREELQPFEVDDLLNMPRYHSMNLIKFQKGYAKFITKLPPPIN